MSHQTIPIDGAHTMHMDDELDLLDQAEGDTERTADEMEFASDLDRPSYGNSP